MKSYPSISKNIQKGLSIYAFAKIDGSNIRAEWSRKRGFYKFGSRNRLLGQDQPIIFKSQEIITNHWSDDLSKIFIKNKWENVICFFEFAGPNSFAGNHQESDDHSVFLIDVNPYKKGILPPKDFLNNFDKLNIAPILYHGTCNEEFVSSVKNGTLNNMPLEGVVCKAKGKNSPIMFKIKSIAWIDKLKSYCGNDTDKFNRLL